MKKNKSDLILIIVLFISFNMFSQHRASREKIKALKISFITEKLNLNEKEATKFWPIYNKFEKELRNNYHFQRSSLKKEIETNGGVEKLTEKEAKVFAKKMLALEEAEYNLHSKFQTELSKIISYKKIVKLQMAERDFNRRLFKRFKTQKVRKQKKENK